MMESVEIIYRTKEDERGGVTPLSLGRWKVVHHISPHKSWECCKQTYEEALIEAKETIEKYFQK